MTTFLLFLVAAMAALAIYQLILARPGMPLDEAKAALQGGSAVLIDIREPAEWTAGVAKQAALLPFSDLRAERAKWGAFLEQQKGKRLLLYCASGTRSGLAARRLRAEGFNAVNAGSLRDWDRAGWPICAPKRR
ncbi:MAG: rhodanese-like domain-containing protein [Opitutus sp.]|nr:rhodanese-like domain-containing protein [Opitutus sp.]